MINLSITYLQNGIYPYFNYSLNVYPFNLFGEKEDNIFLYS